MERNPDPEGDAILIRDPSRQRKQAGVVWLVFLLLASVSGYILHAAIAQISLLAIGLMIATGAGFAGWGAYQLTCCRDEWMLGVGRFRLQRRVRDQTKPRFEAAALMLQEDRDYDGDPCCWLVALNGSASPLACFPRGASAGARGHECRGRSDRRAQPRV